MVSPEKICSSTYKFYMSTQECLDQISIKVENVDVDRKVVSFPAFVIEGVTTIVC
jgi:hypothetical protein